MSAHGLPAACADAFRRSSQPSVSANGSGGQSSPATAVVTVGAPTGISKVNHIIFMLQENRSFDQYFGKLNDYRATQGLGADVEKARTWYQKAESLGSAEATRRLSILANRNFTPMPYPMR